MLAFFYSLQIKNLQNHFEEDIIPWVDQKTDGLTSTQETDLNLYVPTDDNLDTSGELSNDAILSMHNQSEQYGRRWRQRWIIFFTS